MLVCKAELKLEELTPRNYQLVLITGREVKILGTVSDRGGWFVGTAAYVEGQIDGGTLDDVVTVIIDRASDVIAHMLTGWG